MGSGRWRRSVTWPWGSAGRGPGSCGTGYAYIETTRRAYVGELPWEYAATPVGAPPPELARVGGNAAYAADLEADFIVRQLVRARLSARSLEPYQRYAVEAGGKWRSHYAAMAQEQEAASRLTEWLAAATDDRERVFALLTR